MPDDERGTRRDDDGLELAEAFAGVARALLAEKSLAETLLRVTRLAVEVVPGCDHAGISFIEGRTITTPAADDEVPQAVDAIQYETDQGPCLDAIRDHEVFDVENLATESRWPLFARRAAEETGVMSMLSFRLFAEEDTMGALNLYSKQVAAFDEDSERVGAILAAHAAVAIVAIRKDEQKDEAIRGRDVIGRAKGILMARQNISDEEAFHLLRRASQRMNVKLRDVATRIAEPATGEPATELADP